VNFRIKKFGSHRVEPSIGRDHLIQLLEEIERRSEIELFILETNGILFGSSKNYVKEISHYRKVHVRVSLKAGEPNAFTLRTGAIKEAFQLPFNAISNLLKYDVSFHVAAMTDPRIMPSEERRMLIERLAKIDLVVAANLEEEVCDPYETTIVRMHVYGVDPVKFFKMKAY